MRSFSSNIARAAAEALEQRCLLSAVDLQFGTLKVTGDVDSPNRIVLTVRRGVLQVSLNRRVQSFPADAVQSLHVEGGSGNDVISVGPGITVPTQIDGLGGNDRITGSGQSGVITTGPGRSVVAPGTGDNYLDLSTGSAVLNLPATSPRSRAFSDTVLVNASTVIHRRNKNTRVYMVPDGPGAPLMPWQLKGSPTLAGTAVATSGNVITQSRLSDTVTLAGGKNPAGTLTFTLTAPDGTVADSETLAVSGPGVYSTANAVRANLAGAYTWSASYAGDDNNNPASGVGPSQTSMITLATPTLTSTPSASDGNTAGTSVLHDSVVLAGGLAPTGTLTFTLTAPDGSVADRETVGVAGGGVYSTSLLALTEDPGDYTWTALYSGDSLNNPVASTPPPITAAAPGGTAVAPVLTPGGGFPGPTNVPTFVADGFAANELPMARWDVVPFQTFGSTMNVGVVAFHANGISRVAFSVNGGPWASVSQASLNPATNVVEYWVQLDATKFAADGPAEVRAIVFPITGTPLVLQGANESANHGGVWSLQLYSNAHNTFTGQTLYVSATGSDTNDGSLNSPFGTLSKALDVVPDGGAIVIKDAGTYPVDLSQQRYAFDRNNQHYITVKVADGLTPQQVIISQTTRGLIRPHVAMMRWVGMSFDFHTIAQYYPEIGNYVWFDHVVWYNSAGWAAPEEATALQPVRTLAYIGGSFVTDSTGHDMIWGFIDQSLVRNSSLKDISSDAFQNSRFVVNSSVDTMDAPIPGTHNDICQYFGVLSNIIVYNLTATNIFATQDIFLDTADSSFTNCAFVNFSAQNLPLPPWTPPYSQLASAERNVLFQNVSTPLQDWLIRTDLNFSAVDVVFSNLTIEHPFTYLPPGVTSR